MQYVLEIFVTPQGDHNIVENIIKLKNLLSFLWFVFCLYLLLYMPALLMCVLSLFVHEWIQIM